MDFTAFDVLTAAEMDDLVENIESLADGTGFDTGAIPTAALADGAATTAKIADASVTNAKLSTTAGEPGGAWKSWTPTWVNLSGGTLNYAKYTLIGKTVHFRIKYTLAGAGVAGAVTFTTPTAMHADYTASPSEVFGVVSLADTGTAQYMGWLLFSSSGVLQIRYESTATNGQALPLSSTAPHTWGSTDIIQASGTYEAA